MKIVVSALKTFYVKDGVNTRAVRGQELDLPDAQAQKLVLLGVAAEPGKAETYQPPAGNKPGDQAGK